MRSTIKDIAKLSGLSVSTVSRVLSQNPHVSQEAVEKVNTAAQCIGYIPNGAARSLVNKQRGLIGLIIPEMENPFYGEVISGVEDTAYRYGFSTVLSCKIGTARQADDSISKLLELGVDGIIHSGLLNDDEINQKLLNWKVPTVLMGRMVPNLDLSYVVFDDWDSAFQGTRHLIQSGHRQIAFLFGKSTSDSSQRKLEGYREALKQADIPFDRSLVETGGLSFAGGKDAAGRLLERSGFTAIMCGNDMMALGARECILEHGLSIPGDISLVGIDDIFWSGIQGVELTTIRVPKYQMGQRCCEILLEAVENPTRQQQQIVFKGELVQRKSSKQMN